MNQQSKIKYLKKNFDELAILAALAKVAIGGTELSMEDRAVVTALRRSSPKLEDMSVEEIGQYLSEYDEDQIPGIVNNVKGILHEIEFVELENHDGDSVVATIFEDTNHPDTDVLMYDQETGESWDVQLKATDNSTYVADWVEAHPDGEILVTQELADSLDLESSGLSNDELTCRVEQVVDKLIELDDGNSLWDYVPGIGLASVSIIVFALWKRYKNGEISFEVFKQKAAKATGLKLAKIAFIAGALAIPGMGVPVGAYFVARLILTADSLSNSAPKGFSMAFSYFMNKTSTGRA